MTLRAQVESAIDAARNTRITRLQELAGKLQGDIKKTNHDSHVSSLLSLRDREAEKLALFWLDVIVRHPSLSLSSDDVTALSYIHNLKVEKLPLSSKPFQPDGYRIVINFDEISTKKFKMLYIYQNLF